MTVTTDASKTGLAAVSTSEYANVSAQTLKKWRAALARARNGGAVARIACVGDSTTRGVWSNGAQYTNCVAKSWPNQLATLFTSSGIVAQSDSVFGDAAFSSATLPQGDTRVAFTGSWIGAPGGGIAALGGRMPGSTAAGAMSFTPSKVMKSYDVWYAVNTALGTFNVDIGGVGTILVNQAGTQAVAKQTITAGSASTNPLNLTWVSGTVFVVGVEGHNIGDMVSVLNMGWSGSKAADWTPGSPAAWNATLSLPVVAPDLTIISLTINDWVAATDVTAYRASMQSLITAGLQTGDVLLLMGAPSNTANASSANQAAIVSVNYQLAAANSLPLLDITNRWVGYATSNPLGFYGDALHPTGVGYNDIASALLKTLIV